MSAECSCNEPVLEDPKQFQNWLIAQKPLSSGEAFFHKHLEGDADIFLLRQLIYSYFFTTKEINSLIKNCMRSEILSVKAYAISLSIYMDAVMELHNGNGGLVRTLDYLPMLQGYIQRLMQEDKSELALEACCSIFITMSLIHRCAGDHEQAKQCTSESLFIAKQIEAPLSIARAKSALISIDIILNIDTRLYETVKHELEQEWSWSKQTDTKN